MSQLHTTLSRNVARGCIAYRNTRLEQRLALRKFALTRRDVRLRNHGRFAPAVWSPSIKPVHERFVPGNY